MQKSGLDVSALTADIGGKHESVVQLPLENGPNGKRQHIKHSDALYTAFLNGYENISPLLLDWYVDLDLKGN